MTSTSDIPHIWWCPTGPLAFLPLHAAGVYFQPSGPKLSDFAVSSYIPSLSMVPKSASQKGIKQQLLTISLSTESHHSGTAKEVELVASHAQKFPVLMLHESEANRQSVLDAMKTSTWVHFACDGVQSTSNPAENCLILGGHTKLTLSDIMKLHLENAELAFLSASETATGDLKLEDEAAHLAAGMLSAGFQSVIATMANIEDVIAVEVADETYRLLFTKYDGNSAHAAEALHFAVKKVCENRAVEGLKLPLSLWIPFVHIGI